MSRALLLTWLVCAVLPSVALADDFRCPRCGACQHKSVCRPTCEMREKVTYEYQMECEPVCLPGPSEKCGTKCVPDNRLLRGFHWETIWKPRCGCVREQRTLLKIPVKKKEPVYSCAYHRICCHCGWEEGDEVPPSQPPEQQPTSPEPAGADEKIAARMPFASPLAQTQAESRELSNPFDRHR